jgi:glycosyltransferase involved in cell wall biosynthesis
MIVLHRLLRTWKRTVTTFIAVSEFHRQKLVAQGFPPSRIVVKPPLVLDPGPPGRGGDGFLFVGRLTVEKGIRTMLKAMQLVNPAARCVLFPSEWYETFGRIAVESFAKGTPVITSRIGAVAEIVDDGRTGFHFRAGDPQDLARAIDHAFASADGLADMRIAARLEYEEKYTAERNYRMLVDIYEKAIAARTGSQSCLRLTQPSSA